MMGSGAAAICAAFDAMPDAIGVLWPVRDEHDTVVDFEVGYTNPAGDRMMGFSVASEFGARVLEALPSLVEMGVWDRLVRVAGSGQAESAEIEMTGLWRETVQVGGIFAHTVLP